MKGQNKMKKLSISLVLAVTLCLTMSGLAYATTGLTFTQSSPYMIYSNYPEYIQGITGDHYTTKQSISSGTVYTVFFYHTNIAGTGNYKKIGVAIKNTGTSALTVTYRGGGMLSGGDPLDNCGTLALYCANGSNGTSLRSVANLAPGASAYMVYNDVAPGGTTAVGKFKFSTNQPAEVRVFHAPTTYTASQVFSLNQDGDSNYTGDSSRVSAAGVKIERSTSTSINCSTNPDFKLFEYPTAWNSSEYQPYTEWINRNPYCSKTLWGNFEHIYTLNFANSANKTLRLTPSSYNARILTYLPSGVWKLQNKISSGSYSIPLGSLPNSTVKVILVGGNGGNWSGNIL